LSIRAPIVLEVINAPFGKGSRVLLFVLIAGFKSGARLGAGRGVYAELETLAVNVIGERFHVAKLLVGLNLSALIALRFPGVINVDVLIAVRGESAFDHRISRRAHFCGIY